MTPSDESILGVEDAALDGPPPVVVQYLYVHQAGEDFEYPSSRDRSGSPQRLAIRYLECVLVQAASLALRRVDCELVLVTNVTDRGVLDARGARLIDEIEAIGVKLVFADYGHRPSSEVGSLFAASRYVFDAIIAVASNEPPDRELWLVDVDCVWADPARAFAAAPTAPAIGCVEIPYPVDWGEGHDRRSIGEIARRLGDPELSIPTWVGGELLVGRSSDLIELVHACERLEEELEAHDISLGTEEELLSLAQALGRIRLQNIEHVVRRIWTGPRHGAPPPENPGEIALWHLPSEKGLGFRRAARELADGRGARLLADLEDREQAMRRFNVAGAGRLRQWRDDLWLMRQRALDVARSRLA